MTSNHQAAGSNPAGGALCDVLRYIFEIDEESEMRVEQIVKMLSLTGSVAEAVSDNIARPIFQRSALTKQFPCVKLRKFGGQQ